ncbi:deoxycytidylate deaminase [Janthinobacterium sp. BJB401]|nr:anti-phage dCTP deaminase [Janthinobacterium sp. BJB401]NVI80683.1 deoxycytidylate deaminase [Janthinobacterium sp. BJB401]
MNTVQRKQTKSHSKSKVKDGKLIDQSAQKTLEARQSEELVLAFAGPVGCGTTQVISQAKLALESAGYEVRIIKLSKIIENAITNGTISLVEGEYKGFSTNVRRYFRLQDAGNKLRLISSSYLAEHAIEEIVVQRGQQRSKTSGSNVDIQEYVPVRIAYLIDQIKHQDEVALLRVVYRKLFHLIGVISVAEKRRARLLTIDRAAASEISDLMERDRRQEQDNGQQLDKALKLADFYTSTDAGTTSSLQRKLKRFVGLLHGENGISPTTQEYGMYAAYSAGLKSACLSRQVGASISDLSGKIVSTGCNDVPKSSGGLYTTEDGTNDRRCVHREEQVCFNDREKLSHKEDIRLALEELTTVDDAGLTKRLIPDTILDKVLSTVFKASHIDDLTEFSRAVHAEMDAIISLARTGTPGIVGAKLFTTTFPCHSCARHIVAAGISKVYYIEPYEKSLAQKLHSDAIEFDTEDDEEEKVGHNVRPFDQVKFIHFEGVTPRQYLNFFQMTKRKDSATGGVIKIMPKDAPKAVGEYLDDYRSFEAKVLLRIKASEPEHAMKAGLTMVVGTKATAEADEVNSR